MNFLLLNVLIILLCVFIYTIFFLNSKMDITNRKVILVVISGVGTVLCMSFPFSDIYGHYYDLRLIPFMLGALYGGRAVGLSVFLLMIFYRYFIDGGTGFYVAVAQGFILLVLTYFFSPQFKQYVFKKKLAFTSSVTLLLIVMTFSINIFLIPSKLDQHHFSVLLNYSIVLFLTFFLVIYMIEYILRNRKIALEFNESERLRVVSELAASVSHEVKNPLTVTRGFIQLLYERDLDQNKKEEYIDFSLQELDRAQEIISDYLTFANPTEKNMFISINVNKEIEYLIQVMAPFALTNKIKLIFEESSDCFLIGDKQKFRQCLMNLVKNGIEAIPNGKSGEITISVKVLECEIIISIKDNGIGMSHQQLEKLGLPYHSTKEKGTGLGTVVVYNVVKSMGGLVQVESEKGKGTTFTLIFSNNDKAPHTK
ncbi:hypothetical protein BKP37_13840 [Anaerobacillus alkalilacustris]|uniref:histidine kinase n=1 Tax=Anaerobacillus alkalilacustris TaxID=393763 RepID=A0A1S2LM61_9BACI|nr:HAMP domain-containing sensor histidine kinase [Anaerobacillus alkalilacustris]OIJ12505.1 hypothetical protein BKP37_13840 [Anaerobacillus alkalilacustris]